MSLCLSLQFHSHIQENWLPLTCCKLIWTSFSNTAYFSFFLSFCLLVFFSLFTLSFFIRTSFSRSTRSCLTFRPSFKFLSLLSCFFFVCSFSLFPSHFNVCVFLGRFLSFSLSSWIDFMHLLTFLPLQFFVILLLSLSVCHSLFCRLAFSLSAFLCLFCDLCLNTFCFFVVYVCDSFFFSCHFSSLSLFLSLLGVFLPLLRFLSFSLSVCGRVRISLSLSLFLQKFFLVGKNSCFLLNHAEFYFLQQITDESNSAKTTKSFSSRLGSVL